MFLVVTCFAILSFGMAFAGFENGIAIPEETDPVPPSESTARVSDVCIDFDDVGAACVFSSSYPLRAEYAALGVTFAGPGPLDGGAILDECGNFGVTGYSSPNFLAFNCGTNMANGGIPCTKETLTFSPEVMEVSMLIGHASGGTVTVTAFDVYHGEIDTEIVQMSSAMQLVTVSGSCITSVEIDMTGTVLVIDDLCFDFCDPSSTEGSSWSGVKKLYR